MSQDQNEAINTGPPKRFLRKGEGLKRFAAYKPPPPTTAKKPERRQTFVRFRLDQNKTNVKREPPLHFIPPEILNDESINLSTEIPKIAPPKIIHTPVRPSKRLQQQITFSTSPDFRGSSSSPDQCHEEERDEEEEDEQQQQQQQQCQEQQHHYQQQRQQEQQSPQKRSRVTRASDLCKPIPGATFLAMSRQIQLIEATVNELREKLNNCECGVIKPPPTRRRPTTRAAARAAKSQASDNAENQPNGHSANAANENSIKTVLNHLNDDVAQLRAQFQQINLRK